MDSDQTTFAFPCRVGDTVYAFEWNPRNSKYGIMQEQCCGFNIRSGDGYEILLKKGALEYLRSSAQFGDNWFTIRGEAERRLEILNGASTAPVPGTTGVV